MPFKSASQRRYMYSQHPEVAARWRRESGPQRGLPERARRKGDKRARLIRQFIAKNRR